MRVRVQFALTRYNQERLVRLAIAAGVVVMVYWTGRLSGPNVLSFGHGKWAWHTVCYTLMGMCFLIYAASNAAIRWTIIPIGAAFGYLAGLSAQPIVMLMFEPQRMFADTYPSRWEAIVSIFFLTPWVGGAIAGATILILHRGFGVLERWRA